MFIVGIDVGGTFTDLTAVDEATGRVVVTKVPSRPRHEAAAVLPLAARAGAELGTAEVEGKARLRHLDAAELDAADRVPLSDGGPAVPGR